MSNTSALEELWIVDTIKPVSPKDTLIIHVFDTKIEAQAYMSHLPRSIWRDTRFWRMDNIARERKEQMGKGGKWYE